MPSVDDVFNKLVEANTKLQQIHDDLGDLKDSTDAVKAAVDTVDGTLQQGFGELINQGAYTNQALAHNAKQNDTIICILEKISLNTCQLVNEAHTQTGLQTSIEGSAKLLGELYESTHADAALDRGRREALRRQIEECCPPEAPEPVCVYEPCRAPRPLGGPPKERPKEERPPG